MKVEDLRDGIGTFMRRQRLGPTLYTAQEGVRFGAKLRGGLRRIALEPFQDGLTGLLEERDALPRDRHEGRLQRGQRVKHWSID
jgi:hypothetical protein